MLKRIGLFLITNLAVIVVISLLLVLFNIQPYLTRYGLDYQSLLAYALIVGFTGAFISLFMSKWVAKQAYNIYLIEKPRNAQEEWLVSTVSSLARQMGVGMPEVGIYQSPEPNAFATGWNKHHALVAVSTGLLERLNKEEVVAVLGHEVSHIANGDMVTMALLQGVLNTFVIFFARIAAFLVSQMTQRNEREQSASSHFVFYAVATVFEILFGVGASIILMWFSRQREFRADLGSARYTGKENMISALRRLDASYRGPADDRSAALDIMKINYRSKIGRLFASHPSVAERIEALKSATI